MILEDFNPQKKYLSLLEASKLIPYSQDYLRLAIRLGYLKGEKLGRNWFTREEWLSEYLNKYSRKTDVNKEEKSYITPDAKRYSAYSPRFVFEKFHTAIGSYINSLRSYKHVFLRVIIFFFVIGLIRTALGHDEFIKSIRSIFDNSMYSVANTSKSLAKLPEIIERNFGDAMIGWRPKTPRQFIVYALEHPPRISPTAVLISGLYEVGDDLIKMFIDAPESFASISDAAFSGSSFLFDNLYYSVANSPAFIGKIGDFLVSAKTPPSPRQIVSGIREDLARIFTDAHAPSVEPVLTALRDIFENSFAFRLPSFSKIFGLKQPQKELGARPEELGVKPEEPGMATTTAPSSEFLAPSSVPVQVREVIEHKEIVSTADVSIFQKKLDEINQYVLNQFSKVFTELTDLGVKVDSKTPFTVFAKSEKIDQLLAVTLKNGVTIEGDLTSNGSFNFAGNGRVDGSLTAGSFSVGNLTMTNASTTNLSAANLITVSGTGTSTFAGNTSITGNLEIGGTCLNCGGVQSFAGWTQAGSNVFLTTSTNSVGIGTSTPGAKLAVTGSGIIQDTLTIGGTLKATSTALFATDGGSVGIGTTSPWGLAAIEHTTSNNPAFPAFVVSDQGTSTPSLIVLNQNGFTGVATRTPGTAFAVAGAGTFTDTITGQNILKITGAATSTFAGGISISTNGGLSTQSGLTVTGGSILASNIGATFGSTTAVSPSFSSGALISSGDLLVSAGKIVAGGAGTSTFSSFDTSSNLRVQGNLEVLNGVKFAGALNITSAGTSTYSGGISSAGLSSSAGLVISTGDLIASGGKLTISGAGTSTISGGLSVGTTGGLASSAGLTLTGGQLLATGIGAIFGSTTAVSPSFSNGVLISSGDFLVSTGKIVSGGTGTSTFTGGLAAAGLQSTANGLRVSAGDTVLAGGLQVAGGSNFTGNVGIGTTSPGANLGITSNTEGPIILFGRSDNSNPAAIGASAFNKDLIFYAGVPERVRIKGDTGNVGIGTTSPTAKLEVYRTTATANDELLSLYSDVGATGNKQFVLRANGNLNIDGVISSPADYAEEMETNDATLGPGDLVSIDGINPNSVIKSAQAADQRIIGIITTKPGIVGVRAADITDAVEKRSGDTHWVKIAFLGQVPTKVTGDIAIGDRITSSDIPGVGRKAESGEPNVCVAFEPHSGSGVDKINCLISRNNFASAKLDSAVSSLATSTTEQLTTNAWSVAQQSGKVSVNFFGDINLNGNNIINVSKIIGMWGKWSIDENGMITAEAVETGNLLVKKQATFGTTDAPQGITIYDRATKQPVCVFSENGALRSEPGACGSTPPAASAPVQSTQPVSGDATATATTTTAVVIPEQTATTTQIDASVTATSTPTSTPTATTTP